MKRCLIFAPVLMLAGCSTAADDAQDHYRMAEKAGDRAEMCRQARAASDAYLKAGQQEQYETWTLLARTNC